MSASTPALSRIARGIFQIATPFRRSRAVADLRELDDRMLKDVGLTRFDVDLMRRLW
jgi:uncharacterized protein YjiS (DUF1127 family)